MAVATASQIWFGKMQMVKRKDQGTDGKFVFARHIAMRPLESWESTPNFL
jgi:hypothetical protein